MWNHNFYDASSEQKVIDCTLQYPEGFTNSGGKLTQRKILEYKHKHLHLRFFDFLPRSRKFQIKSSIQTITFGNLLNDSCPSINDWVKNQDMIYFQVDKVKFTCLLFSSNITMNKKCCNLQEHSSLIHYIFMLKE